MKICPTCEGEVKFDIIDGKCKACRLGVIPDWAVKCIDCGGLVPKPQKHDHICAHLKERR